MSDWSRERLLRKVSEVTVWKKGDERAPHKPLLILYALGKLLEGENEIRFKDFYEPFRNLLQEFGPPRKSYHPEFPFWYLRTEGFWEVEPATGWMMKKGGSSPSKSDLLDRNAVGRFVPEVQYLFLHDLDLPGEVVSLVLKNHFPDSIHDDVLEATHLEQLPTAKPKRDPRFRGTFSGFMAIGVWFAVSIFDWTILRWRSMRHIFVGIKHMVRASFPMVSPCARFTISYSTEGPSLFLKLSPSKFRLASMARVVRWSA
jgi:hypothetical protein